MQDSGYIAYAETSVEFLVPDSETGNASERSGFEGLDWRFGISIEELLGMDDNDVRPSTLAVRTYNILKGEQVDTVRDILGAGRSRVEDFRNLGEGLIGLLELKLSELNLPVVWKERADVADLQRNTELGTW